MAEAPVFYKTVERSRVVLAYLPKLIYVVLALVSYLVVHQVVGKLGTYGDSLKIPATIAYWAQYVLPCCFLLAALFTGRSKPVKVEQKVANVVEARPRRSVEHTNYQDSVIKIDPFRKMSRQEFDQLMLEFFEKNGFTIIDIPSTLGDGVDCMMRKGEKTYITQYRYWREQRIDLSIIRQQHTIMQVAKAHGVYVVTTGEFSYKALKFAEDKQISLIDGLKLRRMVNNSSSHHTVPETESSPSCPECGAEMFIKTGSAGGGIGKRFWGCSKYPKCNGKIMIRQHESF